MAPIGVVVLTAVSVVADQVGAGAGSLVIPVNLFQGVTQTVAQPGASGGMVPEVNMERGAGRLVIPGIGETGPWADRKDQCEQKQPE